MANFFTVSNVLDTHNQIRQGGIALEEWAACDCWLRFYCTMLVIWKILYYWSSKQEGSPDVTDADVNRVMVHVKHGRAPRVTRHCSACAPTMCAA